VKFSSIIPEGNNLEFTKERKYNRGKARV